MEKYTLSPDVLIELEETARSDKRSITDLLNQIVKEYVARRHDEQISAEASRFRAMHAELHAKYPGQYIAMVSGQVVDHDSDLSALHQRIRAKFGNAPILIAPVTAEPAQEFRVRRPHLERIAG